MLVSPQGDGVRPRKGTHERDTALGALAAYLRYRWARKRRRSGRRLLINSKHGADRDARPWILRWSPVHDTGGIRRQLFDLVDVEFGTNVHKSDKQLFNRRDSGQPALPDSGTRAPVVSYMVVSAAWT